jgi:hypothetical protein
VALIGCAVLLVLGAAGAIGGYFVIRGAYTALTEFVESNTATEPLEIPEVQMSEDQVQELVRRVDEFRQAVESGQAAAPLALTGPEINAVLQNHPDFGEVGDMVYVTVEGDTIRGDISIPLDEFGGFLGSMVQGRYLNGSGEFSVTLVGDRPVVFLEALSVNDRPVPQEFMEQMGNENLAKDLATDPDFQEMFKKLESIEIENGKLVITPKSP